MDPVWNSALLKLTAAERHIFCGKSPNINTTPTTPPSQVFFVYYPHKHITTMVLTQSKFLLLVAAALYTSVDAFSPSSYSPQSVSLLLAHLQGDVFFVRLKVF
jgi:hypothetical protein